MPFDKNESCLSTKYRWTVKETKFTRGHKIFEGPNKKVHFIFVRAKEDGFILWSEKKNEIVFLFVHICDINDKNMGQIMTNKSHVGSLHEHPLCTLNDWSLNISISIWPRQNGFLSNSILLPLHIECPPSHSGNNHNRFTWTILKCITQSHVSEGETSGITYAGLLWDALSQQFIESIKFYLNPLNIYFDDFFSLACTASFLSSFHETESSFILLC